jgi:hypothetical protein
MPSEYTLVAVDVSGIQEYIFRSNNLKHQLGASELVRRATSMWVRAHLPKPNNMLSDDELLCDKHIEDSQLKAEVLYSGGGNAVILFSDSEKAGNFIAGLTRTALLNSPGLNVTVAHRPFTWREDGNDLGAQVGELLSTDLRRKKQSGFTHSEMLGLSVTADCEFTGLPAVGRDDEGHRISAEIEAKRAVVDAANSRLKHEIGISDQECVLDFGDFGTEGESSYIAVVHTDGNRIGKRFQKLSELGLKNRDYIQAVRALSQSVNEAAQEALKTTVNAIRSLPLVDGKLAGVVPVRNGRLPFRPIVFGGDDVTFVCDGRLGLTATARYLEAFTHQMLDMPSGKEHPTARAGIAIVKTHFPFGQAYRLAEALARLAKSFNDNGRYSTMDWHFGINGVVSDLQTIRKRDYMARDGQSAHSLLMRPLRLESDSSDSSGSSDSFEWRTWSNFAQLVSALQNESKYPRNKLMALRDALRGGPETTKRFIAAHFLAAQLPQVPSQTAGEGWTGKDCVYFDAIEAMEFFIPL